MTDRRDATNEFGRWLESYQEGGHARPPLAFAVCPVCDGRGSHVDSAIDGHGITADEMDELGDDFRDDYLGGRYDVVCGFCDGKRVVEGLDLTTDAGRAAAPSWDEWQRDAYDYAAEVEAERRMGA